MCVFLEAPQQTEGRMHRGTEDRKRQYQDVNQLPRPERTRLPMPIPKQTNYRGLKTRVYQR